MYKLDIFLVKCRIHPEESPSTRFSNILSPPLSLLMSYSFVFASTDVEQMCTHIPPTSLGQRTLLHSPRSLGTEAAGPPDSTAAAACAQALPCLPGSFPRTEVVCSKANTVDPEKEDTYYEGLLVANWARIKNKQTKTPHEQINKNEA